VSWGRGDSLDSEVFVVHPIKVVAIDDGNRILNDLDEILY
jgi:hypothetical protein